jgi:2-keto-4-pentenoate hydratase/2-oxohepta-3-ene-1,7-dioic acid hydratase in catechol pathway
VKLIPNNKGDNMRLCRFNADRLGVLQDSVVCDVTAALSVLPSSVYPLPRFDPLIAHLDQVLLRVNQLLPSAARFPLDSVKLLSPVANPGKIVAAPVNYKKHLEEARADAQIHHNNQVLEIQKIGLFLKATSSLVGPSEGVLIRHPERRNDHEAELVVVIGKSGSQIRAKDAWSYIAGYSIGLDMTTRGPEERSLRKSIDSYSVLGPCLVTADEIEDPSDIDFWLTVNDEPRQKANTRDLIIGIPELIEFASAFYTLHPGDLIYTGTPEGVGPVQPGDRIVTEFRGIGRMEVAVHAAPQQPRS